MKMRLQVLLINPPIYDVAAYGFWSAPLGLLYVGAILRKNGMELALLDCLKEREDKRKEDGRAPFFKEKAASPECFKGLSRRFRRYGAKLEEMEAELRAAKTPDLVLVTTIMTYWYPGAVEAVRLVRTVFPKAKIVVGGIYTSLCPSHAAEQMAGADLIVGRDDLSTFYAFVEETFSYALPFKPRADELSRLPYPAFDLYEKRSFVPLLTSTGCAFNCTYCATSYLRPHISRRLPGEVLQEIEHWQDRGVSHFALYDDNFLFRKDTFSKPLLRGIGQLPFETAFYNPNALNASLIDREAAALLRGAGFREVRIGLETVNPEVQKATGDKVDKATFERALSTLLKEGFPGKAITAYVLAGLPLQPWEEVKQTIDYVEGLGINVNLAQYTPIPHTAMFEKYRSMARYPISEEPLFQNNALFPFAWEGFTEADMNRLKACVREGNERIRTKSR